MENSLVRPVMSAQRSSNQEKKDPPNSTVWSSRRNRPSNRVNSNRYYPRGSRQHDALCSFDRLETFEYISKSNVDSSFCDENQLQPSDGYKLVSSQIYLTSSYDGQSNPDSPPAYPNWEFVNQTVHITDEDAVCPICLETPIAPRMERCGHIYCGPCSLQYINYDNSGTTKKCAVCSWVLKREDLKRVLITYAPALKAGSVIEMALVNRLNDKVVVVGMPDETQKYQYALKPSAKELRRLDIDELNTLLAYKDVSIEDGNTELVPYISQLIEELKTTVECSNASCTSGSNSDYCKQTSVTSNTDCNDRFSFYQASDGRPIFLDGLPWKCLLHEFVDVACLPNPMKVLITSIKTYKMSSVLRRRWRHLNHLPIGHMFCLLDVDLVNLVSQSTLDKFASAISRRTLERDREKLEDLRLTKLKEAAENRIPSLPDGFKISGHDDLLASPKFTASDFSPLCSTPTTSKPSSAASFAEVTKLGALSVVDSKRVATFGRNSLAGQGLESSNESWPTLNSSSFSHAQMLHSNFYAMPIDWSSPHDDRDRVDGGMVLKANSTSKKSKRKCKKNSPESSSFLT